MSRQTTNFTRKLILNSPDRKPSVFERLGTKSGVASAKNVCQSWAQNGTCPLNKQCKLVQTHVLISSSKRSKSEAMKKSVVVHKKCKDEHKKSLRSHHSSEIEWEGWELGDLEDADEKVLEKRKQELQRELQLQLKKEKELTRKKEKRTEKKRAASSSSSLTTTSESSSSTTSSTSSSSEPRKRTSRKRKHSSSSSESERSSHRQKKTPKTVKAKVATVRKPPEKKDSRVVSDVKSKSVVVAKKTSVQKKSYSPSWEKSRGKSPAKQPPSKKSPHHSPAASKNKSASPRYDKAAVKGKSRNYSPKSKGKESSPKRGGKKGKESNGQTKDKPRQSPAKAQTSPSRARSKVSPPRSRRHEETSEKRRGHYEDQKHSPRRDRSREKDRKRDGRRGRSDNDNDSNGGLKKGGKILPLKPPTYSKDNVGVKKESSTRHKSCEKNASDLKSKEENIEKDRNRSDREKNRGEKEKGKCERDKSRHKRGADEHEKSRSGRERDSDRGTIRSREDRGRDREAERLRLAKDREAERQKEREEALERCRERQRERERLEKERKEKEEKKHQREIGESKSKAKDYERELPSLLDLKAENPARNSGDGNGVKSSEKHLPRESRGRNPDKGNEKSVNQDREGRDRGSAERDHRDQRDSRRSNENEKRQGEKEYEGRKNRGDGEVPRNSSEARRNLVDGRRGADDGSDSRRQWVESVHDRRRTLDSSGGSERRPHPIGRRPVEDSPYRRGRPDGDGDFSVDDRRSRKMLHNCSDWDGKDQNLDYRDSEGRDDWNHPERHRDWNSRYDHPKWMDREESRDSGWNHYPRRSGHEEWNGDWTQEQQRQIYSEEERLDGKGEGFADQNGKKQSETEQPVSGESCKEKETAGQEEVPPSNPREKPARGDGDALSDISDDPDDILNQDDYPAEESLQNNTVQNSNQQIYIRSNEFLFDQRRSLLECLGERSLDFEEISDEELEEEARASKGIVDVLGADWAALLQETRPKPKRIEGPGSAHCRWTVERLIFSLGISVKHAGKQFSDRLIDQYGGKSEEKASNEGKTDSIDLDNESEGEKAKGNGESTEPKENVGNSKESAEEEAPTFEKSDSKEEIKRRRIFHSVPALHGAMRDAQKVKSILFLSHNRFKRALSARTDLSLRRELCNLPSKEPLHFTPPLDGRLYEASVQQFLRGTKATAKAAV